MITSEKNNQWEKCYLCESTRIRRLYKVESIFKCKECKFVFYKNIPSAIELNAVYSNYSREEYITDISRAKIKAEFEKILADFKIESVLDIACGECYFLDTLNEINPQLELFATEHETAKERILNKGHRFLEGEFFPRTELKFDLIIFTEAIEHINDINEFLKHANNLLNPNGLIYITTPNFSSVERFIMGRKWGMVTPPEHLSYFTSSTLNKTMNRNQFKKVFSYTENISIFRIVEFLNKHLWFMQTNKGKDQSAQRISDQMQQASSANYFLKKIKNFLNYALKKLNLGSSLKALYKKK